MAGLLTVGTFSTATTRLVDWLDVNRAWLGVNYVPELTRNFPKQR